MLDSRTARVAAPTLAGVLVGVVVVLQVAYPLAGSGLRDRLTVAIVVTAAAAALAHAAHTGERRLVVAIGGAGVLGFGAEVLGVHAGVPFGTYTYAGSLGPRVFDVPLVVGLAWIMMSWPAALVARRLVAGWPARVAVGAWALAAWDMFLDPQMVDAGHWRWAHPQPHLPGVDTVPISNFLGWLAVSVVISAVLQTALHTAGRAAGHPRQSIADGPMIAFYLWTYASSVLGLAVFFGLPAAAAWGALGMGVVALPLARRVRPARP